jgi:sugar/nucleoside kinase (ribokinase family)
MSKRWDVVGVGCNSVDYVYRVPASPRAGSPTAKLRISSHQTMCGGQMATALVACAGFGLTAAYLGCVGNDHNGRLVLSEIARHGVDTSHVLTRECANRFAVIAVDDSNGERIVLWDRDDALGLERSEIDPALIGSARLVHVDDEDQEAAIAAAAIARAAGVPTTSDIDRITGRTGDLVAAVSLPIFAEHVLPAITGESDIERALRALRRSHQGDLYVTLGSAGSALLAGDDLIREPAVEVIAVDTTGAGDVFRAALIAAILNGASPRERLRFANTAAALSCTRAGAIAGVPTREEVGRLLTRA